MDRILLHVCCGPCSTVPLRLLAEAGASFAAFYDNSNIQPAEEYEHRRATFCALAEALGVESVWGSYEPDVWDVAIGEHAGIYPLTGEDANGEAAFLARREARCRRCYAHRFARLAARARALGFSAIATTLSISPYQFTDVMAQELAVAARREGLESAFVDYREFYQESVHSSRELGLYRQNYCGCRYSKKEAELERAARKAAKRKASQHRQAERGGILA
jgi:predicted adenine nucleotide alpha hydrolase (AANH) superfamily ATPase